jgi:E3 ubiquitin-protein ligase DOA10
VIPCKCKGSVKFVHEICLIVKIMKKNEKKWKKMKKNEKKWKKMKKNEKKNFILS